MSVKRKDDDQRRQRMNVYKRRDGRDDQEAEYSIDMDETVDRVLLIIANPLSQSKLAQRSRPVRIGPERPKLKRQGVPGPW